MTLLETRDLTKEFGAFRALSNVDVHVKQGEIFGLLGPNGSGKTTWMNCVTGIYKPTSGQVLFREEDVTAQPAHVKYRNGMGRTFQLLENFPEMTVMDNMLLAVQENDGTMLTRLLKFSEDEERERANQLLEFVGLTALADESVKDLSYGQQKLCDLAMTLMPDPEIVLLDEPMAGVNPALIEELVARITELNAAGKTFVIIEHNMKVVMNLCTRLVVLDHGERIAEGRPNEIQENEKVLDAYFGT